MLGELTSPFWLLCGAAVLTLVSMVLLARFLFSPEARLRRRRRKNYGRPVSKHKGPMVKLAVNTKKSKD